MERTKANKFRYEAEAGSYDRTRSVWVDGPLFKMESGLIKPHLGDGRALDVGYGTGRLGSILNENAIGLDLSFPSLVIAKTKHPKIDSVCADAVHLPFRPSVFDEVVCSRSLKFFDGLGDTMNEFSRVTKIGGEVILTLDYCLDYFAYRLLVPLVYHKTKYESHYKLSDLMFVDAPLALREHRYFVSIPPLIYEYGPARFVNHLAKLDSALTRFTRGWCVIARFTKLGEPESKLAS